VDIRVENCDVVFREDQKSFPSVTFLNERFSGVWIILLLMF